MFVLPQCYITKEFYLAGTLSFLVGTVRRLGQVAFGEVFNEFSFSNRLMD